MQNYSFCRIYFNLTCSPYFNLFTSRSSVLISFLLFDSLSGMDWRCSWKLGTHAFQKLFYLLHFSKGVRAYRNRYKHFASSVTYNHLISYGITISHSTIFLNNLLVGTMMATGAETNPRNIIMIIEKKNYCLL